MEGGKTTKSVSDLLSDPLPLHKTRTCPASAFKARLGQAKWAELLRWRSEHHWHPHQARHTGLTALDHAGGAEVAQVIAGHTDIKMTKSYTLPNVKKAYRTMERIG